MMLDRKPNPAAPTTVGAYEAKTKFSELIARAEKGESFVVTKNGRPVACITPVDRSIASMTRQERLAKASSRALMPAHAESLTSKTCRRDEYENARLKTTNCGRDRWL